LEKEQKKKLGYVNAENNMIKTIYNNEGKKEFVEEVIPEKKIVER